MAVRADQHRQSSDVGTFVKRFQLTVRQRSSELCLAFGNTPCEQVSCALRLAHYLPPLLPAPALYVGFEEARFLQTLNELNANY